MIIEPIMNWDTKETAVQSLRKIWSKTFIDSFGDPSLADDKTVNRAIASANKKIRDELKVAESFFGTINLFRKENS